MSFLRQLNNPTRDFQIIPRKLVQIGLSPEAVGLMVMVACLPPSVDLSAAYIEDMTGWKRDKRQKVMRELVEAGLLRAPSAQAPSGRWYKLYIFDWDGLANLMREPSPKPVKPVSADRSKSEAHRDRKNRSQPVEIQVIEVTEEAAAPSGVAAASSVSEYPNEEDQKKVRESVDLAARAAVAASLGLGFRDPITGAWRAPGTAYPAGEPGQGLEAGPGVGRWSV